MATAIEGNNKVNKQNIGGGMHPGYSMTKNKPNEDRMTVLSSPGITQISDSAQSGITQISDSAQSGITKISDSAESGITKISDSAESGITILCIFDGHGGEQVSNYVNINMPPKILAEVIKLAPKYEPEKIASILTNEFLSINKDISDMHTGSTGTVCVVTPLYIVTANIGDSPAILFTKEGDLIETTTDHDCKNTDEVTRIIKAGNSIIYLGGTMRLKTGLAVTRSFGDRIQPGVIATPQIYIWEINMDIVYNKSLILAVFSDSFAEELKEIPRRHIGPYLTRNDMIMELNASINSSKNMKTAARNAVRKRVNKLKINGYYQGDNTSLLLMEIKPTLTDANLFYDRKFKKIRKSYASII